MLLKYMKQYIEKLFQSLIAMALLITAVLSICIFSSVSILDEIQNMEDVQIEEEPDDSVVVMELNRPRDLLLEQQLKEYVEQYRYSGQDIAYCIQDMDNHEIYAYNADQDFFAASIYKLSLAMLYEDMIAEGKEQVDVEDVILAVIHHNKECLMDYADSRFKEEEAKIEEANTKFFETMAEFGISRELAETIADAVSKKAKEDAAKAKKEKNTEDTVLMDLIKEFFK